ncbi:MAG: putative DNA binding domain-containing protein [Vicinamibacteria bacterium]|nr:putative DNA binding domain-containing protein [Vicinamibacteria bacterium]
MKESQRVEWKESWRDDCLKVICGFANAEGGTLVIGRNDAGGVAGVKDARKLLEDLPNKVRDILGILVDVNLKKRAGREYLEIVIPAYTNPISYRGEFYYRSGSTNQALKAASLERFLLRKQGRTWDGVPIPRVRLRQLSRTAFATFRKLARLGPRNDATLQREPIPSLLDKLNLLDGKLLKRAGVLLFHPDPERFIPGAFVKIGYFRSHTDLLYQDEIHGDLFSQAKGTIDTLLLKYLKAAIRYEGIQRVESYGMPVDALREALLNALIHRDYSVSAPIQIRVYSDRLSIWNPGELPEGWSVDRLMQPHASKPYNPLIASAFFRAGEVETWGRGIQRIFEACEAQGSPRPVIHYETRDIWVDFPFAPEHLAAVGDRPTDEATSSGTKEKTGKKTKEKPKEKFEGRTKEKTGDRLQRYVREHPTASTAELAESLGLSRMGIEWQIRRLKRLGLIIRVGPDKGGHWEVFPFMGGTTPITTLETPHEHRPPGQVTGQVTGEVASEVARAWGTVPRKKTGKGTKETTKEKTGSRRGVRK